MTANDIKIGRRSFPARTDNTGAAATAFVAAGKSSPFATVPIKLFQAA